MWDQACDNRWKQRLKVAKEWFSNNMSMRMGTWFNINEAGAYNNGNLPVSLKNLKSSYQNWEDPY